MEMDVCRIFSNIVHQFFLNDKSYKVKLNEIALRITLEL